MKIAVHKSAQILLVTGASIALVVRITQLRSQQRVEGLLQGQHQRSGVIQPSVEKREIWMKRNRNFANLWLSRHDTDISSHLLSFLEDPDERLRLRAVRGLGHLESPKAQVPLMALLKRVEQAKDYKEYEQIKGVPPLTLKLALGRIQACELKGQDKAAALAKSAGLTWDEVVLLSQKINKGRNRPPANSPAREILNEAVSLLYKMGKQGQDIQSLSNQLSLSSSQKILLQAATLSTDREIALILDYATNLKVVTGDDEKLIEHHMVGLGDSTKQLLKQRLKKILGHPEDYSDAGYGVPLVTLLRAASLTGDQAFIPLLKQFENNFNVPSKSYVQYDAKQAIQALQNSTAIPNFPS